MKEGNKKIELFKAARYVGLDLAKKVFGIVITDENKRVIYKKIVKAVDFFSFLEQLPQDVTIFMEGCGTSQYWARELQTRGFTSYIVPAQLVTPYVQFGKKNDLNDAIAIIEAGLRDGIHFIPIKTPLQRELCALTTRRSQLVEDKVKLQNQIHAIFREAGCPLKEKKTTAHFIQEAHLNLEVLKVSLREKIIIQEMLGELKVIADKVEMSSKQIELSLLDTQNENSPTSRTVQKMLTVYGVGPITVATMVSHLGTLKQFKNGRHLSAFLGLTPRQFSSGGKTKLGSITKSGSASLRALMVLCANSFLNKINRLNQDSSLVKWIQKKLLLMTRKKLVVALANKLARILWAVSVKDEEFVMA